MKFTTQLNTSLRGWREGDPGGALDGDVSGGLDGSTEAVGDLGRVATLVPRDDLPV